ncbi:MAG: DoxX family protein [Polyangiales bacterium]
MRQKLADNGIFLLRIAVAIMMLSHGVPKALEYDDLVRSFPDPLNVGTEMSAMLIVFAEVGCSVLLLIGLFGRFAATALFIAMMVAAFVHHFTDPWIDKELPLLYAAVFACLALTGPGSTSIDGWFAKRILRTEEPPSRVPGRAEPEARP